jgi:1-acyl-sn-glycerol-3-phosphate acyltransferase
VGDYTWPARLRERALVPLDQRFNLRRRGVHHAAAQLGMWTLTALAKLAFRIELVHGERLPKDGPFLLCPTHQSMLDSPLIYAAFPYDMVHRTVFIAFGPYFRAAPLSWLVRMGRLILTGEGGSVTDSLRLGFDALGRGLVVCIFPEGACSPTGEVITPRPGVGILACEAQVPVVPVVFQGSHRTVSPRHPGLRPTKIRVLVGEPIPPPPPKAALTRADHMEVAERWRVAVRSLQARHAGT